MGARLMSKGPLGAALAAAVALAGCGEERIDIDKTAAFIKGAVAKRIGSPVKEVDCPQTVVVQALDTFTCAVIGTDGTRGDARLTQKDDQGSLSYSAPFLNTKAAERIVQRQLRRNTKGATVSCPQIVIVKQDTRFECQARSGSSTKTVFARQTDSEGNFTYRIG